MVCEDMKVTSFQEVSEMFDSEVDSEQFPMYLVSAGFILLEKKEIGCHAPLMCCCNTAPTAVSEASVVRHVGASGLG